MSRQNWMNAGRTQSDARSTDWRVAFSHVTLEGRTSDPEALEWDEADEIFRSGLRCARRGDLEAGRAQIASAFLLDTRAINYCNVLPDPAAGDVALDLTLIEQLMKSDPNSLGTRVLHILLARTNGSDERFGQGFIGGAMKAIEELLKLIELHPEIEKPADEGGALGGCLTRTNLLFHRSSLHCAMGNHKLGVRDLTAALKIDPTYYHARSARASLYAGLNLKDRKTIHTEFKRVVSEVHEDNRGNEVSYAWLAITTLDDPQLGTLEDAKRYHENCLRATARRAELYGPHKQGEEPDVLGIARQRMAALRNNPDWERQRQDLDRATQAGLASDGFVHGNNPDQTLRHVCLSCGQTAIDKGLSKLLKCGRCKQVSYCSKECQTNDWKNHKAFCKQASSNTEPAFVPPKKTDQRDSVAKDPISEVNGHARACVRMREELSNLFSEHGQRFADWWHRLTSKERSDLLLEVTNNTIPCKRLTEEEIRRFPQGSRCLQEYNVEDLIETSCHCSNNATCNEHIYTDRLLHEIYIRSLHPEKADAIDKEVCQALLGRAVLPVLTPGVAFINPPNAGSGPEQYDLELVVLSDEAPEEVVQSYKDRFTTGELQEGNTAFYVLSRQVYSLSLLVKVFDTYQVKVRRCFAKQPQERLMGCNACRQTCEGEDALKCDVCRVVWWCCGGCKMATDHGKKCPNGKDTESVAMFD